MTSLVVAPVALRADDAQLRVELIEAPDGGWLSAPLKSGRDVPTLARELLADALPEAADSARLENAGVAYLDGEPHLVITSAVPMVTGARSRLLVPWEDAAADSVDCDPVQRRLIEHWRNQLTRTNAALDLLPKYFTSNQVRAVYSSLWGWPQSDGNFARWLRDVQGADGQKIRADLQKDAKRSRAQVRNEVRDEFAARAATAGIVAEDALIAAWPTHDKAPVGTSAAVSSLPELTTVLHPGLSVIGAEVGAKIAFQDTKKGSPPNWHTRAHPDRTTIEPYYSVRPKRDYQEAPFVE